MTEFIKTGYECPDCGWSYNDDGFYYVDKEEHCVIDCTKCVDEKTFRLIPDPPKGKKAYPLIDNYHHSLYASYNCGVDGHDWDETHLCPNCLKEFSFSNSDY